MLLRRERNNWLVHVALKIIELWALAFLTLALALTVLNLVWALIEFDLALQSLGRELLIAGIASLVEGGSVAAMILLIPHQYLPLAARIMLIPAVVVGIIYKATHYEDWSRYEVFLLLAFQLLITGMGVCLLVGFFGMALVVLAVFVAVCGVIIAIGKSL